jgi:hypothetical protein
MKKLLFLLSLITSVYAQSGLELGQPGYGGTGCPAGSASAILSPDSTQLSIMFDQFTTEAGGATRKRTDRKFCQFTVPIRIPAGYQLSVMNIDYRGYVNIPYGGSAEFSAEYFLANMRGPRYIKSFRGAYASDYYINNKLGIESWSMCGGSASLRVTSNMAVTTDYYGAQAQATVDSVDLSSGIIFQFRLRPCY